MERWLRGRSIRSKLRAIVLLTAGLALVVSGLAFVAYDAATYKGQRTKALSTDAEILGILSAAALTFDDADAATEYLAVLRARPVVIEAATYDAGGRPFASYRRVGAPSRPFPAARGNGHRLEGDDLLVFRAITKDGEHVGTTYLRANLELRERLLSYGGIVLAVSAGSLAAASLLLSRLQGVVSRPLLEVTQVARAVIHDHDYGQRVVKRSEDEVGVLVDAFNQMLEGIQERERSLKEANEALQVEIGEHEAARRQVTALAQDLERRVAERTAELEAANKELEAFSYSVSHDLRAPLRSIDGFTSILQTRHADRLDEQGRNYMERVRAASQRMGHLIDDLLKLSRTVRTEMVRGTVDLSEMARSIVRELQAMAPDRRVAVEIAPALVVNADPALLKVVLENLIGNAWKFTSRTDRARIEVGTAPAGEETAYFVRDNGAGFDMKYAGKLFGAFQRLHALSDFEGTGVGLATVQRVIRRHGGRIWVEAAIGEGATFYFTLQAGSGPPHVS